MANFRGYLDHLKTMAIYSPNNRTNSEAKYDLRRRRQKGVSRDSRSDMPFIVGSQWAGAKASN